MVAGCPSVLLWPGSTTSSIGHTPRQSERRYKETSINQKHLPTPSGSKKRQKIHKDEVLEPTTSNKGGLEHDIGREDKSGSSDAQFSFIVGNRVPKVFDKKYRTLKPEEFWKGVDLAGSMLCNKKDSKKQIYSNTYNQNKNYNQGK